MSRTEGDVSYCAACDRYFCRACGGGCACTRISAPPVAKPIEWQPIATVPSFKAVLLYCAYDLYPVVGWKQDDGCFMLEEGGPEDGSHRTFPILAHAPTHWAALPETPE